MVERGVEPAEAHLDGGEIVEGGGPVFREGAGGGKVDRSGKIVGGGGQVAADEVERASSGQETEAVRGRLDHLLGMAEPALGGGVVLAVELDFGEAGQEPEAGGGVGGVVESGAVEAGGFVPPMRRFELGSALADAGGDRGRKDNPEEQHPHTFGYCGQRRGRERLCTPPGVTRMLAAGGAEWRGLADRFARVRRPTRQ